MQRDIPIPIIWTIADNGAFIRTTANAPNICYWYLIDTDSIREYTSAVLVPFMIFHD